MRRSDRPRSRGPVVPRRSAASCQAPTGGRGDGARSTRKRVPSSRSSTGIRSSAEWTRSDGQLGRHRPHREEAVRDRAEGLAQVVAVREAREHDRRERPRPGPPRSTQRCDRLPERRVERRARPADALDPLELVVALAETRAHLGLGLLLRLARAAGGSRSDLAERRDHVPLPARRRSSSARP